MLAPVEINARTSMHLARARYEGTGKNVDAETVVVTLWLDDPFARLGRLVVNSLGEERELRANDAKEIDLFYADLAEGSLLPLPSRSIDLRVTQTPGATFVGVYVLEVGD